MIFILSLVRTYQLIHCQSIRNLELAVHNKAKKTPTHFFTDANIINKPFILQNSNHQREVV